MGGRFDATNVIKTPLCSVITSISFDHTAILGDTLEKIAFEKCGIIKHGGNTVFYPQQAEVNAVIETAASERANRLWTAAPIESERTTLDGTAVTCFGTELVLPLLGRHQLMNLSLVMSAVSALETAGVKITPEQFKKGIESVRLPARFERLSAKPLVIADGAHNPDGMRALSGAVDEYLSDKRIVCVIGMLRDKECLEAVSHLRGRVAEVIATTVPDNPRRQTARELAQTLAPLEMNITPCEDPHEAVDTALEKIRGNENAAVLICGSLYLVAEERGYVAKVLSGTI